jgi:ATP-dependent Lon protease
MAIGGLKEKTMAALRHGVKTVIIPADNEKDLEEIDQTVRSKLTFIPVSHVDTVISTALDLSQLETPKVMPAPEVKLAEVTLRQ